MGGGDDGVEVVCGALADLEAVRADLEAGRGDLEAARGDLVVEGGHEVAVARDVEGRGAGRDGVVGGEDLGVEGCASCLLFSF